MRDAVAVQSHINDYACEDWSDALRWYGVCLENISHAVPPVSYFFHFGFRTDWLLVCRMREVYVNIMLQLPVVFLCHALIRSAYIVM